MAKKSRRVKKRTKQKRSKAVGSVRQSALAPDPTAAAVAKKPATQAEARATKGPEEKTTALAEEYRYVYSDLQRIAILAGAMLAVLILLSFVIG